MNGCIYIISTVILILLSVNFTFAGNFLNEVGKVLNAYSSVENDRRLDDSIQQIINRNGVAKIGVIVDVRGASLSPQERQDYSDMLSNKKQEELLKKYALRRNEIRFVERSQLRHIIDEQKIAISGLTDINTVQIGKLAGIDIIFLYTVFQSQASFKAIMVSTGEILASQTDDNASLTLKKSTPITLIDEIENLKASSWKAIPLNLSYNGTLHLSVEVVRGNKVDIVVIQRSEIENYKSGRQFRHFPNFEASKTKVYKRSGGLNEGPYYLVIRDNTLGILSAVTSDIKITARLDP